jgi:hypothetical protein
MSSNAGLETHKLTRGNGEEETKRNCMQGVESEMLLWYAYKEIRERYVKAPGANVSEMMMMMMMMYCTYQYSSLVLIQMAGMCSF